MPPSQAAVVVNPCRHIWAWGFPGGASGKEPICQCRRRKRCEFDPWVKKIPWRRAWQPAPVFLPGEFPWTEEPGRLRSIGSQSRTQLKWLSTHICIYSHGECSTNNYVYTTSSYCFCQTLYSRFQWQKCLVQTRKLHSPPPTATPREEELQTLLSQAGSCWTVCGMSFTAHPPPLMCVPSETIWL